MTTGKRWNTADALELYNIPGWSQGYFGINGKGHLVAYPGRDGGEGIDLRDLLADARAQGLSMPLLIRFSDILRDRLEGLHRNFARAIEAEHYGGRHIGVYPIKVNQQRQVVDEVVRFGAAWGVGLEAGSKPELHAVLAMLETPGSVVVCNGYKDAAYVRLALRAQRLGHLLFLVVEKPAELPLILRVAEEEGLRPRIGVRVKLASSGSGKWEDTGGEHSKFGLTTGELVQAVELLQGQGALDCLGLVHFHLGSQISDIQRLKGALREMGRYFAELHKLGCPVAYVDVGGGLGVDYDGSGSAAGFSVNYTDQEYAADVVGAFAAICRHEALPYPTLITESGRALTAHHAMLAVNVLETAPLAPQARPPAAAEEPDEVVARIEEIGRGITARNATVRWHEATYLRDEANHRFELGYLSLHQRARFSQAFWGVATRVDQLVRRNMEMPAEFADLELLLADKYFCNFSVFQSLPDSWAIGQQFPVVPLHRLNERPTRRGILYDITCDSDGKIKEYIGAFEDKRTLPLHPLRNGDGYYLGIFLTGAYQEILGDLHNLFGNTNAIHVALNDEGGWRYEQIIHGENVANVLSFLQFNRATLIDRIERRVAAGVAAGSMTPREGQALRDLYTQGLDGLTYLEQPPDEEKKAPLARRPTAG